MTESRDAGNALVRRFGGATLPFDPDFPPACPPVDAEDVAGTIYRAVPGTPVGGEHFVSWVREQRPNAKPDDCRHWGLSVWTSLEAVNHARRINAHIRSQFVAAGELAAGDGVIKATPTKPQPQHHTLWCCLGVDLAQKFQIVIEPAEGGP